MGLHGLLWGLPTSLGICKFVKEPKERTYELLDAGETLRDRLRRRGTSPHCAALEGPRGAPSTSGGETGKETWREGGRREAPSIA